MNYTTTGKVFQIGEVLPINANLKKKELVITRVDETDSAYPNMVFELLNADVSKTDGLKVGDGVKVTFAIHGRAYTKNGSTKHFNNLRALAIEPIVLEDLTPAPVTSFDDMPDM